MICPTCHNLVPPDQLACGCFVVRAQQEEKQRKLEAFQDGRISFYRLTNPPEPLRHLLMAQEKTWSLCGTFEAKGRPTTIPVSKWEAGKYAEKQMCAKCWKVLQDALNTNPEKVAR